jgi:hypothetical protein
MVLRYVKLADLLIPFDNERYKSCVVYEFVTKGSLEDIDALLRHDPCHKELLFEACMYSRTDVFDHLVSLGTKPDSTCLQLALSNLKQSRPIIDKILALDVIPEFGAFWDACVSCSPGDIDVVKKFILYGTNINEKDFYDPSAMTVLIKRNLTDIVLLILSLCTQINNYEKLMATAIKYNNQAIVDALSR